jgi:hypothetical protein
MSIVPYAYPIPGNLIDPGVAMPITVLRRTGEWLGNGLWSPDDGSPATITGSGILYPSTPDELQALPEGERVAKSITLYWPAAFEIDDRIQYNGEEYRVIFVDPWNIYGYNRAIAKVDQIV